jgi:uncharacterized protein (TIGR03067 family)
MPRTRTTRRAAFLWLMIAAAWLCQATVYGQNQLQDPADETTAQELERQQGTWQVVSSIRDGMEGDPEIVASIRRIVTGDHVVWERDGKPFSGSTIVVIPGTDPRGIDVIPDGGPARGKRVLGIYKFDDERLVLCMADADQPRPTTFSAETASRQTLMVFKKRPNEQSKPRKRQPAVPRKNPPPPEAPLLRQPDSQPPARSTASLVRSRPIRSFWAARALTSGAG